MYGQVEVEEKYGLIKYGIYNEGSDIRAHVCPIAGKVYVFETAEGVKAIDERKHRLAKVPNFIDGKRVIAALGYLVPPDDINGIKVIPASDVIDSVGFRSDDNTSTKGRKGVEVVAILLASGRFPLWIRDPEEVTGRTLQISGTDIIVNAQIKIQVKADVPGGAKKHGGTGNLFLQTHERNYMKAH